MPQFESKYTDKEFLDALKGTSKTIGYISRRIGSARATTVTYLERLQKEGKVIKESIDDGNLFVYKLTEQEKEE